MIARTALLPLSPERVTRLQTAYVEGQPNVAEPPLASLQRALIKLGLSVAERDDGFPDFAKEVKSSLWPRRASRRSGRGPAEARPKDQHATDAGDAPSEAARLDPSLPVVTTIPQGAPLHELDDPPAQLPAIPSDAAGSTRSREPEAQAHAAGHFA